MFAGNETAVMPAVILGLRNDENLYLSDKNAWQAKYLPAFIRRYPFAFSSQDDGKTRRVRLLARNFCAAALSEC